MNIQPVELGIVPPIDVYPISETEPPIFPDFQTWKQTTEDDHLMKLYLAKGYCAPREVAVEYQVGRSFVAPLFSAGTNQQLVKTNKLDQLNDLLSNAQLKRRDFNKVQAKVSYNPPPRMTLTEHKRDIWLKRLSDPKIPLTQLSKAIPHGLRNKTLLEQCLLHNVSISRTIWLIKCVASNEQRQLNRKPSSNINIIIERWVIEWTEQITTFLEGIILDCFCTPTKGNWSKNLDFAIDLTVNVYVEGLINKVTFLTWIVRYLSKIVKDRTLTIQDLRLISVHYLFLQKFWFKIIKFDYLSKELGEAMLYLVIGMNEIPKNDKYDKLVTDFIGKFHYLIRYLFYYNSDAFIIPSGWTRLKLQLKKILDIQIPLVVEQYNLIHHRNESLMIDDTEKSPGQNFKDGKSTLYYIPGDLTSLIVSKLNNFQNESIEELVKLIFEDNSIKHKTNWRDHVLVILKWSIQNNIFPETASDYSSRRVALVIALLRKRHSQLIESKTKKSKQLKTELEIIITSFVNNMSEILNYNNIETSQGQQYSLNGFLLLITKLNEYNIFITSSYLRKLIASGVIYLSKADRTCYIHLLILNTITELRTGNSKNILKRLSESTGIIPPFQDSHLQQLKSITLTFWDKITSSIELNDESDRAIFEFKSQWIWNLDPNNSILYSSLKYTLSLLISGLLKTGKLDSIDTGVEIFKLSSNKLFILLSLGVELDILDDILESIIIGIDSNLFKLNNETQLLKFETENGMMMIKLLKLVVYYERLLKSTLSFTDTNKSKWAVITDAFQRWADNDNKLNICEWEQLLIKPNDFDNKLFNNPMMDSLGLTEILNLTISNEELSLLGFQSIDKLLNESDYNLLMNNSLMAYINFIKGVETHNYVSIINFMKFLRSWKPNEFKIQMINYITRNLNPTLVLDYELNRNIVTRMIGDELLELSTFIEIFDDNKNIDETSNESSTNTNSYFKNGEENLISDILFFTHNDKIVHQDLEAFKLRFQCWKYSIDFPDQYFKFVFDAICQIFKTDQTVPVNSNDIIEVPVIDGPEVSVNNLLGESPAMSSNNVVNSDVNNVLDSFPELNNVRIHQPNEVNSVKDGDLKTLPQLSKYIIGGFWALIDQHMDLFIKFFYYGDQERYYNGRALRNYFLDNADLNGNLIWDKEIDKIVKNLSYFNLSLYQWIFRGVILDLVEMNEFNGVSNNFVELILNLIRTIKTLKNDKMNSMSIVGELFSYLPDKIKIEILLSCEDVYLTSDSFPSFLINGENMTEYLNNIISSCSRFENDDQSVELTNALVFSLNMSIEKLTYYCHGLDNPKRNAINYGNRADKLDALKKGLKMISKIIMLHQKYLVNLIIKRSINLQKDVLLMNLTRLYNNRIMTRSPKLKNLLYDVMMSLKILITESIIQEQQRQAANQNGQLQVPQLNTPIWLNKGTPNFSMASPKVGAISMGSGNLNSLGSGPMSSSSSIPSNTMYVNIPNILNIKPPSFNSNLKHLLKYFDLKDTIKDNEKRYYIVNEKLDRSLKGEDGMIKFILKPFDMIEDTNIDGVSMDTPISLNLFECSFNRKNPA